MFCFNQVCADSESVYHPSGEPGYGRKYTTPKMRGDLKDNDFIKLLYSVMFEKLCNWTDQKASCIFV